MSAPSGRLQPAGQRRQSFPCRSASAAYVAKSVSACPSPAQNHSKPSSPWKPANSASSASCLRRKIASRSMCRSPFSAVPALVRRSRTSAARPAHPGTLLDAQEQRIAIAPARRVIGARLDRGDRRGRGQRIDHQHVAAEAARPAGEPREIRQIADSPARARARRVELGRESPGAKVVGQVAASRADHQQRLAAAARIQAVVAERQLLRQRAVQRARAAVLQHQVGAAVQRAVAARQQDAHGVGLVQRRRGAFRASTPMAACSAARVARDKSCFTPRAS